MLVRVERNPQGPRLHVARRRIHHAHAGFALILLGVRLVYRDRRDFPWR